MKLIKQLQGVAPEWNALVAYEIKDFEDQSDNEVIRVGKCIRISINIFRIFIFKFDLIINYWWR
jgi:hypothetical protein